MAGPVYTRRNLLTLAAGATAISIGNDAFGCVNYADSVANAGSGWDHQADVIIVGTGAAACSAAVFASEGGSSVLLLEKHFLPGGTTAKSGGRIWIPNNFFMRNLGIADNREDCLRFMARLSYPELYDPRDAFFGLPENEYQLLAAYYDNAAPVVEFLANEGVLNLDLWMYANEPMVDYYSDLAENKAPQGRALEVPLNPELGGRGGAQMVREFQAALTKRGIPVLLDHRVNRLVTSSDQEVVGVECQGPDKTITVRARKAVIFGTGGFTHNPEMINGFVRGPLYGGCAASTATGDFVYMATAVGAKLANMSHVWGRPLILEQVLQNAETPDGAWLIGDSLIQVNPAGRRITNEMLAYNERNQVHYQWDPVRARYSNLVSFVIYDEPCRQRFGTPYSGISVVVESGMSAPYVIRGETLEELETRVRERLASVAGATGGFTLDDGFTESLRETIVRYNRFAVSGIDEDFRRGETLFERNSMQDFMGDTIQPRGPNPAMAPISSDGPFYCVLICPGTLDTKGGPKINARAQIVGADDEPIGGLYGAGNCIGSPAGQAYWSGGATLGLALTFGAIAGRNASSEPIKSIC